MRYVVLITSIILVFICLISVWMIYYLTNFIIQPRLLSIFLSRFFFLNFFLSYSIHQQVTILSLQTIKFSLFLSHPPSTTNAIQEYHFINITKIQTTIFHTKSPTKFFSFAFLLSSLFFFKYFMIFSLHFTLIRWKKIMKRKKKTLSKNKKFID